MMPRAVYIEEFIILSIACCRTNIKAYQVNRE